MLNFTRNKTELALQAKVNLNNLVLILGFRLKLIYRVNLIWNLEFR